VLLGAAGTLVLLTGFAAYEMSGRGGVRKSEIDSPASAQIGEATPALDDTPTGAIGAAPKVIAAPLPAPGAAAPDTAKPAPALVAALPPGVNSALVAAAANGDLGAEIEIAQRFLEGRTVPRDPKVAADWLQTAADAGSPFAQYRLGALYEKGVGVAKDAARARALYTRAADAGNARAMHNLAVLYAQDGGQGKPDYTAALEWFKKAGALGVRDSQFNLGVLYGRGLGAGQDLAQAWLWFSLAARQGDTDAAHKRDEVALRMDGRAMTAAKKALDDFKVLTPDPAVNDAPAAPPAAADAAPDRKDAKKPV
jgi:localization factor PodJL